MNMISMNEMYAGETAQIVYVSRQTDELKKLYAMGIREGKLVDMILCDYVVSKKVIVGIDNTRITFDGRLTRSIKVRPLKSAKPLKVLIGMLPICANCKRIRDDKDHWWQIEQYIHEHSEADFTHGICPECVKVLYPFLKENYSQKEIF